MTTRHFVTMAVICIALGDVSAFAQQPAGGDRPRTLEELMQVEVATVYGAAKRPQRVSDAPASVTVITADEIAAYGWRSFADVLATVRGFYVTYDRNYSYLGVRGFGRPTDYNNRVLVLIDGHRLNDNVYDAVLLGDDFPLALDLIDRVEIIRGPGSALYGTNAFFAVINVVTRAGGAVDGLETSVDLGSHALLRSTATFGTTWGSGHQLLLSADLEGASGNRRLFFPEYAHSPSAGLSIDNDGRSSQRVFARLRLRQTEVQAGYGRRGKDIPTGAWASAFNDPRNRTVDSRTWVEVSHPFQIGRTQVRARASLDRFTYEGRYAGVDDSLLRDHSAGDWLGAEVTASRVAGRHHVLVGVEHRHHLHQDQWAYYEAAPRTRVLDVSAGSRQSAVFAQDEITLHPRVTAIVGGRYDYWSFANDGAAPRPRVGAIVRATPDTSIKLLYGEAFRQPNVYEMFYSESTLLANPRLRPETLRTAEVVVEQYVRRRLRVTATAFRTAIDDLISQVPIGTEHVQHQNRDSAVATGVGVEGELRLVSGAHARASYSWSDATDRATSAPLTNSPRHLGVLSAAMPWSNRRFTTAFETIYVGARLTHSGDELPATWVASANAVLAPNRRWRVAAGLRNVFNTRYAHPVGYEFVQDTIVQDGRTWSLRATVRF